VDSIISFISSLPEWLLGLILCLHVLTVAWIYFDAQGRHAENPVFVIVVIALAPVMGQLLWLLLRPRVFEMDSSGLSSADFREWNRTHQTRENVESFQTFKQEAISSGRLKDEMLEKMIRQGDFNSAMRLATDNLQIARDVDPDRVGLYESYLKQIADRMAERQI